MKLNFNLHRKRGRNVYCKTLENNIKSTPLGYILKNELRFNAEEKHYHYN
eukprot:UN18604